MLREIDARLLTGAIPQRQAMEIRLIKGIVMRITAMIFALATSGCADVYLDREERRAFTDSDAGFRPTMLDQQNFRGTGTSLGHAAATANKLAEAYFQAARKSSRAQDITSGVVIISAASVVAGAVGSTSETGLADRALVGVGAETVARRGVSKVSIQSILKGAKTMNCISAVATIYSASDSGVRDSPLAKELTFAAIREVRVSVRDDIARDVADFSELVTAFKGALPEGVSGKSSQAFTRAELGPRATKADLEAYLARLSGCLTKPKIADNTKKPASVDVTVKTN